MLFTVSNTSVGGNASGVHMASTLPKKKLYLLLKDWNNEKEIPQSRVQVPCMAHKTFLVDIHGDGFPFRGYMDVPARLGVLAM